LLKKKLHTALSLLVCCLTVFSVKGQANASNAITIPEVNITAQSDVISTDQTIAVVLLAIGNLTVKSSSSVFTYTSGGQANLNLGTLKIKGRNIGGSPLNGQTEVPLSPAEQIIGSGGSVLGTITVDYRVPTSGTIWVAGTYTANVNYNVNSTLGNFTITVPAYITSTTVVPASSPITVNSFAQFRSVAGVNSSNISFGYNTTVPTLINLKAKTSSTFTFTPGFTSSLTFTPVNSTVVNALLSDPITGPVGSAITLTTTDKPLTPAAGLPVILTSKRPTLNTVFNITGADLLAHFVNAGVYKLPITYTIAKTAAFNTATTSKTMDSSVDVTVANMMDINLPSTTIALDFTSQSHYSSGVTAAVTNQVMLSSTVPYNITVKAGTAAFVNASDATSTIPLSVMTIEGMSGQSGITPITLTTNPQTIVSGGIPVIDRKLNLQYRIPSAQVSSAIFGKPPGNYNATIIYTIVAP
jgi:hypothetical protein